MTLSCVCGKFHYSLDHYFAIHGDYLGKVPEHRIQVPFLPNGKLYDKKKYSDNEPCPSLTHKWVCKYCGNFNTSDSFSSHKSNCAFVVYLKFRETEPFKKGYKITSSDVKPSKAEKPSKKPSESDKYVLTDEDKKKINNYRDELLNIIIKVNYDYAEDGEWEEYVKDFKEEHKNKPVGYFWEELRKVDRDIILSDDWTSTFRKYAYYCDIWEQREAGGSAIYQPEKKRRMIDWYLLSKLSFPYLTKLEELKKDDGITARIDPNKKYLLSELLLLVPKRKKPKPKPENAPLWNQIERFGKEYAERLVKYIDLDAPPWYPVNEIDKVGKIEKYWTENGWRDYLENAKNTQNTAGNYIDLDKRIKTLKIVFAKVVIERLIEKRQKHELENFMTSYSEAPEKDIWNQEPYKTEIENIFNEADVDPFSLGGTIFEEVNYYDELFSNYEREAEEWTINPLNETQWNKISLESDLRKGIFDLRNFPKLKKLKISINRPYLGALVIKKINLGGTADNLEELDLSHMENLEEINLGRKVKLIKVDCRWTILNKLDLRKTALTLNDYDSNNFFIRDNKGSIVWPFENYTGDSHLITLPRANIQFNIPWIKYGKDWTDIAHEFKKSPQFVDEWYKCKFDFDTARNWMNVWGTDPNRIKKARLCAWIRDVKRKNAEWVLNHDNQDGINLEAEYIVWLEKNRK